MDDTKYWLWLSLVFGNSGSRISQIMCSFETAAEAYYELCSDYGMFELTGKEKSNIKSISLHHSEEIIENCRKKGIGIVGYSSEKYPSKIRYIFDPPAVLYYKGNIDCLCGAKTISCVGTRKASSYGLYATERICSELAENGIVIISGFAVGIDIKSHLAAVSKNKPTVCVLGCGVDVDYPNENFKYRDRIIDTGGVFISEFGLGTRAYGSNFPRRNRILSALGQAAVIFQASLNSGAIITADHAAEQGRDVFCLPPPDIFSYEYSGNIELLRSGAFPLFSANDILAYLDIEAPLIPDEWTDKAKKKIRRNSHMKNSHENEDKAVEINNNTVENSDIKKNIPEFKGIQNDIIKLLSGGAVHADIIAQTLNLNPTELMTELTELEIINAVRSLPGKMFEMKVKE